MNKSYWKAFKNIEYDDIATLPISHNTCYQKFLDIIDKKAFRSQKEDEFYEEKRAFFYYGIPAYLDFDQVFPSIFIFDFKDEKLMNDFDWVFMDSGTLKILNSSDVLFNFFKNYSPKTLKEHFVLNSKDFKGDLIKYIKSHVNYFFEDNSNYYDGVISISDKKAIIGNTAFFTVEKYYEATKGFSIDDIQKKIYKDAFKIDKRDRIIEGSTDVDLRLSNLKCIACYVPLHAKEDMIEYFELKEDEIQTYESRPNGMNKNDIIKDGMEWVKSKLQIKLTKNNR